MPDRDQTVLRTATKREGGRKCYFIICDNCFWCASSFESNPYKYPRASLCPSCEGSNLHAIPLAYGRVEEKREFQAKQKLSIGVGLFG